ncbi:bacillithiol system redox-active protein YtxJ [Gaetbulibacter aestuarii]
MSLIRKLFKGSNSASMDQDLPWTPLSEASQIAEIKENSKSKTQIIFKHSTRCGISSMVMNRFKNAYDLSENQADLFYLDLIENRGVSNAVADTFGIRHESPQLLIVRNGSVVKHDSHSGINEINLDEYI